MTRNTTMNFSKRFVLLSICFGLFLAAGGCKAAPAEKPTAYLGDTSKMTKMDELPFNQSWYDHQVNWEGFKEVYVAPVHTEYIHQQSWWEKANFSGNREEAVKEAADYLQSSVKTAFREDPKHKLMVVDKPGPDTMVMELALTELVPTKAWLNVAGYAGVMMALDHGTVAMEGKIRKGADKKVIGMFADREKGKAALVSAADLTWSSHAHHIMDDWSEQFVEIMNTKEGVQVSSASTVTLKPW